MSDLLDLPAQRIRRTTDKVNDALCRFAIGILKIDDHRPFFFQAVRHLLRIIKGLGLPI